MAYKVVELLYHSWDDLDRAVAGLSPEETMMRHHGSSSIAWTMAHVAYMLDSWVNVRFHGLPPNPVISDPAFRAGGTGQAKDWSTVVSAVNEVRAAARHFLDRQDDFDRTIPYTTGPSTSCVLLAYR